jgi:hypothetical protein
MTTEELYEHSSQIHQYIAKLNGTTLSNKDKNIEEMTIVEVRSLVDKITEQVNTLLEQGSTCGITIDFSELYKRLNVVYGRAASLPYQLYSPNQSLKQSNVVSEPAPVSAPIDIGGTVITPFTNEELSNPTVEEDYVPTIYDTPGGYS